RYTGDAIVAWFVVMFGLVIAAGLHRGVARTMPRLATIVTLVGALMFSLSIPTVGLPKALLTAPHRGGHWTSTTSPI
ncbi:MAG: hypothetical protein QOJ29_2013, partial [Thermoleophilaceae bacterium]|nr:hypothetical protein [Thermoleophilaceae bacterium]